ncbi:Sec-independent protein translocase subunit TatA [Gordonia hankookensis]|uniref:Sec-independent protein translocase protein TatA n=1 Tax=Gordonia hankookensis TaxID=589403 RepID=A0ABR7WHM5_9ACTN|nr:Sec-independent protein translocase subunit TatA [Gordonia hankookensis]MBD1322266.1 Sec-independent protein translocase subunit TatA [Gordonia hankookensis]
MGALSWWHWVIVLLVVVILFGSKKLPDAARGLGQSLRIFKSEVKEMQNDGKDPGEPAAPTTRELPPGEAPTNSAPTNSAPKSPDDVKKSA